MTKHKLPKVAVCLAAYNGIRYLPDQLNSIFEQTGVSVTLFVSVDKSSDGTETWIDTQAQKDTRIVVLPHGECFGAAAKNFFRLLLDLDFSNFDYISFADQDDIWEQDKLIRHIKLMQEHGVDGVSSNVLAFWADGKKKIINKSQPQRELDFLFESAGPGCSFLMTPWLVNKVREQLTDKNSLAKDIVLHDWLTYAICRAHGHRWMIDSIPSVQYRQHENNVMGANAGWKAKWIRFKRLKHGWYRREVIKIVHICNGIAPIGEIDRLGNLLAAKNLFSQLKLLAYVTKARRSLLDRYLLALLIAVGIF